MKDKLRIGVLVNSSNVPAWVFSILEEIHKSSYAELVLMVENNNVIVKKSLISYLLENWKKIVYLFYTKLDRKLFKSLNDPLKLINLKEKYSGIPNIKINPKLTKFSDYFSDESVKEINKYNLDVVLRFGFRILRGKVLGIAKYGIWSYHHGDNNVNRGGPPGFWEVMNGFGETGSILQILSEDLDGGSVLYRSYSQTDTTSVNRNINQYYWKTNKFIPRKLKELYTEGKVKFFERIKEENQHPDFYSKKLYRTPGNLLTTKLLINLVVRYIKMKLLEIIYTNQWQLRYAINKEEKISKSFYRFKNIVPPEDRYWADPFVIKKNDKYFVFIEEVFYTNSKGHISVIEIDNKGDFSKSKIVLSRDYHLSFPFIFEVKGNIFMIPETSENRTIELFKCLEFPHKWELEKELMKDVIAVDSNLFYYENKWWLFTNIRENEGSSTYDELFLFYSDDFDSDKWYEHPNNPIVSDVKSARPAGKIFEYNGNLYRPSQNSKWRYGYSISINQIIKLDEYFYEEKLVNSIKPDWDDNLLATHTFNNDKNFTIIDVLSRKKRFIF